MQSNIKWIKCQVCGTQNFDNSLHCDECGDLLQKYQVPATGDAFANENFSIESNPEENAPSQSTNVISIKIPEIGEEKKENSNKGETLMEVHGSSGEGSKKSRVHARLVIERGHVIGTEFSLVSNESNIGRWDADNGIFPDIDLDSHDLGAKVSRKHARIMLRNGEYLIEDLGSTNGTFINRGKRLIPGNPHRIKEGDEIIVGKTFLRFHISD